MHTSGLGIKRQAHWCAIFPYCQYKKNPVGYVRFKLSPESPVPVQLLSTKLFMPPLRPRLVARSRLIQKLNSGMECGFVLVSAPAGYGKSTLLSAWLSQSGYASVWLSLDDRDNDPARFLAYLTAALRQIDSSIEDVVENLSDIQHEPDIETRLTPLINQLAQIAQPFCLVLDDYHTIQNQTVHQVVSFLLEHRPTPFHLFIATRADPPLPLARLRARSELVELRLADLRFTLQEATDFLYRTMGLRISPEDTARITARTEGWIAGLQMAALSMQKTEDVSGFIATLNGSHHYIFDYLVEEILRQQSPDLRRFLLYTSIVDQLTAGLCEALLGGEADTSSPNSASVILEALDQANLFILPLDHERRWYRYHHLFAELLRLMVEQYQPGISVELHHRACRWYETQGMLPEALTHAISAGDMQRVAQMISANVLVLVENHEITPTLLRLDATPPEQRAALPWLSVAHAWALAYTGQMERAEAALLQAEKHQDQLSEDERSRMMGHIGVVRAYDAWVNGDQQKAVEFAMDAALLLPLEEYAVRALNITTLGNALTQYEAEPRAVEVLEHAVALARQAGQSHVFMPAATALAYAYYRLGKFRQAHAICLEALELDEAHQGRTGKSLSAVASVYAQMAIILGEWGEIEKSIWTARKGLALSELWGQTDTIMLCLLSLASALSLAQDTEATRMVLQRARRIARTVSPWFVLVVDEIEMRTCLDADEIDQAAHLAQRIGTRLHPSLQTSLLVKQNRIEEARAVLECAMPEVFNTPSLETVRLGVIQSLVFFIKHDEQQALSTLKQTLELAAPENRISTFVREGAVMEKLLQQALVKSIYPAFVRKLLAAFEVRHKPKPVPALPTEDLLEPLTEREMDVLKLLAQGFSDKKIAQSLVIARETVHKHLKNIYGKLDVHSRTEAIVRAGELDLLS